MSIWGSFKKKLEDTWETADFWDKDENARQVAARTQAPPAPRQSGGLRVGNAQPTQTMSVAQPQQQPELRIAEPVQQKPLTINAPTPKIPETPEDFVNAGLDAGKSWEDISRETGLDLKQIQEYSQATRPNYGVARMEQAPQQGFWNKVRDTVDANTEADKWRRQQGNEQPGAEQKPLTLVNPGNVITNTVGAVPRMFNTAGKQLVETGYTAQQVLATKEYSEATQEYIKAVKSGDPNWIAASKVRLDGAASRVGDINEMIGYVKEGYGDGGGLFNAGTMYNEEDSYTGGMEGTKKILGNTVEGITDVASLGLTTIGGKQLVKQGFKEGLKNSSGIIAKNAGVNTIGGASSAVGQGGGVKEALVSGAVGGTVGTVADIGLASAGAAGTKTIQKLLNNTADTKIAPSVFQKVNPETGEKIYKVIDEADFEGAKADIDGGFAGTRQADGFSPHLTAKTPAEMEALGFTNAGKYDPKVDGTNTASPTPGETLQPAGAVKGKTQQIGDLLDMSRFGKQVTEDADDLLAKQYGVDPATVRRLRNGYGDENARNILASTSDATNIRDMNAFVISEARKRYGSPNVRIKREPKPSDMSPEEAESLYKTAPEANTTPEAPEVKTTETPNTKAPQDSPLGTITEKFYDRAKGKNVKIGFRALEALGQRISRQVDDDFAAIGSDFSVVAEKIQQGIRNGAKTLEDAGLTPEEAIIMRKAQAEMNYIRRRASLGNKEVNEGNFGEMYLPQQKKGQFAGERLFEGFRDTMPGSEKTRKNRIELEDLDYSPDVIGQYIVRYGDTKAYRSQRIFNALKRENPTLDDEAIRSAADKVIAVQDKINNLKTKIGAFGFGTRKTTFEGKTVDTVGELSDVGKQLGKQQVKITAEPKGFTNGDKINSVTVGDKTLGDYVGLNQYRDAKNYGAKQVLDANGDRAALARMIEQRLTTEYNLSDEALEYIMGGINRMADDLPNEVVTAKVVGTYTMAAKQQMLEQLQNLEITNPKLKKTVSDLTNQILREGTIEKELSQKVVSKVLQTTNAIFRKLNISSAMNELGDLPSFLQYYGKDASFIPDFKAVKEFGLGDIDAAIEPYIKQVQQGKSIKSVLKSINNATNLYKFVEAYKAGVVASSAKKQGLAQGLTGDQLTQKVLREYRDIALPVDAFTKTFLDNAPLYTQYMTWGARNLQKEGRLATGKLEGGRLADMTRWERVASNAYTNLPAKTVFWLASNGLKGTAILTAFGLTDFTGLSSADYSGIREEDKSWFDKTTEFTNASTTFSLLNNIVQSIEKDNLKEKYADESYNPYENNQADENVMRLFTPQFIKNIAGADQMLDDGYSENASGKVQYEAPTDLWNTAKAYVFGKGNTENAREYSGRKNIQDRIAQGENPFTAVADMAKEQLNLQDTDYNRPLTDDYSKAYKEAEDGARTAMLEGGRAYNNYLDDLRDNQPEAYDRYISSMKDHVNPEYWRAVAGGETGKVDLTVFNMNKNRKKQLAKDLGTAYDPIYDLPDDQAKAVIQQKATATGDDIALRNSLYKEQWYNDYMDRVKEYYNNKAETVDSDYEQTERVKNWYALNDQYNGLRTTVTDDGGEPEWAKQFPTVYQQKLVNQTYGFDSEESKNFFKTYGDAYKAEKALYDQENLALINKMREIEGYPPMSEQQYAQVTTIENTDDDSSGSKYNKYGSGSSGSLTRSTSFGQKKELSLPSVKIKVPKVKVKRDNKPKTVKLKRNKNYR